MATIDCVVSPELQRYEAATGAVSVTDPPAQNVEGPPEVTVATGAGFMVTANGAEVAEQPSEFVTVTVTLALADKVMLCVMAPLDQAYAAPFDATSVTEPP